YDTEQVLRALTETGPDDALAAILRILAERPAWQAEAYCRELRVSRGRHHFIDWPIVEQRPICQLCPVRPECVRYAAEGRDKGRWGATTEADRVGLRRLLEQDPGLDVAAWLAELDETGPRERMTPEQRRRRVFELRAQGLTHSQI